MCAKWPKGRSGRCRGNCPREGSTISLGVFVELWDSNSGKIFLWGPTANKSSQTRKGNTDLFIDLKEGEKMNATIYKDQVLMEPLKEF